MIDIAICGTDTRFCRMLELELQALGYTVARDPQSGRFRLWVIDLDTVTPGNPERICLGITRDEELLTDEQKAICQTVLQRPFPISDFRREITRLLSPEQSIAHTSHHIPRLLRASHGFELDGEPLALTDTEEQVLSALYDRRGTCVSRRELCALLGSESNDKLADVYICLLRKKLETNGIPRLLFTVRGVGYRLEEENQP